MDTQLREIVRAFMAEINHELLGVVGDFLVAERVTESKYLEMLDEGSFTFEHPDGVWKIRFTPDHKVHAERTDHIQGWAKYDWYFQTPALNEKVCLDISELMEAQVGV